VICYPTPVLWYRIQTADVLFSELQNCPHPPVTITRITLSIFWNFLLLPRTIFSGALPITDYSGALSNNCLLLLQLQLQLIYDRQSVGQSVLVSGAHLGPGTNFSFSLKFLLDKFNLCGMHPVALPMIRYRHIIYTMYIYTYNPQSKQQY
jgi:hypothetical protein